MQLLSYLIKSFTAFILSSYEYILTPLRTHFGTDYCQHPPFFIINSTLSARRKVFGDLETQSSCFLSGNFKFIEKQQAKRVSLIICLSNRKRQGETLWIRILT